MSRWATTLAFDGDDTGEGVEYRAPFLYAENRPPDTRGRGGDFSLAETYADNGEWDIIAPFLRVTVIAEGWEAAEPEGMQGVDVVLDEAHVRELHGYLGEWLGRLG